MNANDFINDRKKQLEDLAEFGIEYGKKLGADAVKVVTSAGMERRLVVENKEFTLANTLETLSLGFGVHHDNKKGSTSINIATRDAVKAAIENAMKLAKFSVPDEYLTLSTLDQAPKATNLDFLYNESLADLDFGQLQEYMQTMIGQLSSDPRVALDRSEISLNISYHGLANSNGVKQDLCQSAANWWFMGMGRDGDQVTGMDYDGNFAFDKDDILPKMTQQTDQFVKKILNLFNPIQPPSYKGTVALSPRAVSELLLGTILFHTSGRQIMDGRSQWKDSIGKLVANENFTLTDNPHDRRLHGATGWDSDGLPTSARPIIEKGVLKMHLMDCYSAKKLNTSANGMAGGPYGLSVEAGNTPIADLLKDKDSILVVDRFSGNSDPLKGDFSGVAKASHLFQNGEDKGSVTETLIAGNIFAMLKDSMIASKETEIPGGGHIAPYIIVDGVSVSGNS